MSSNSSKTKNLSGKAKARPSAVARRRSPGSSRPNSRPGSKLGGNRGGNGSRSGTPKPKGGNSGRSTPSSNRPLGAAAKVNPTMQRREEGLAELENHFILRMPQGAAGDLRKIVNTGSQILKDKLAIEIMADMRHGTVKFNDNVFSAKVMDLPCTIESHKTIDKKTFWKTADICQMLVCNTEEQAIETEQKEKEQEEKGLKKTDRVDKKFLCNHGITPSLKNVRKRRFRKTAKKKYIEAPDVEEEVKRLLRMDSTAIKIRWEVLAEEDVKDENRNDNLPGVSHGSAEGDDLTRIFGDVSSSEDEEEDINILDMDEDTRDSALLGEDPGEEMEEEEEEVEEPEDEDSKTGLEESEHQPNEFVNRLDELRKELVELEEKQRALEESISTVDNMLLKDRFQSQLDSVLEDIKTRQKEVETLEVLIGDG